MSVGSLTSLDPNTINKGFYASGSGDLLIKGKNEANKDYIKFTNAENFKYK